MKTVLVGVMLWLTCMGVAAQTRYTFSFYTRENGDSGFRVDVYVRSCIVRFHADEGRVYLSHDVTCGNMRDHELVLQTMQQAGDAPALYRKILQHFGLEKN